MEDKQKDNNNTENQDNDMDTVIYEILENIRNLDND